MLSKCGKDAEADLPSENLRMTLQRQDFSLSQAKAIAALQLFGVLVIFSVHQTSKMIIKQLRCLLFNTWFHLHTPYPP